MPEKRTAGSGGSGLWIVCIRAIDTRRGMGANRSGSLEGNKHVPGKYNNAYKRDMEGSNRKTKDRQDGQKTNYRFRYPASWFTQ